MSYHWIELTPSSNPVDIPDAVVEKAFGSLAEHAQLADGSRLMIDPQLPFESPGFKPPQADQHTMQFELLLAAFQSKIWKKIQALRCSRNLISPIYRLPSEVLIDIFLLVHDYTQRKNDYKALHQMAQVCCAWRDIILSNPCFWTYVSVQLPLSMNKQIIKLSKNAPLHTDLRYWKDVDVEKSILLECLVQEVSRWKGVICNNDQMVNMMDQMVQEGVATTLEYFQWTRSPLSNCEVPSLIQERAPRLRELEIMGLPLVPLDLPILSRIKVLRFTPSSDMLQSHTHWERLLSCIPEIETMEVRYSCPTSSLDEEPGSAIIFDVRLLHLRDLYLNGLPNWIVGMILSSITLDPNEDCPSVTAQLGNHFGPLHSSFPAISRASSLLSTIRDSATELVFDGSNRWDVKHQDRSIFLFTGKLTYRDAGLEVETLRAVLGPLTSLHLKTLRIHCVSLLRGGAFVSEIHNLPILENLYIAGDRVLFADFDPDVNIQALGSICEALSAPRIINGDALAWPCPRLTSLHCDRWPDLNPVLRLLRARYGPEASSQCPAPSPLRRLTLSGNSHPLSYETSQLIEEIKRSLDVTNTELCFE